MNAKHFNIIELLLFIFKAIIMIIQAVLSFAAVVFELKGNWQEICIAIGVLALLVLFITILEQVFSKVKGMMPKT
jgi:hypothetical protein